MLAPDVEAVARELFETTGFFAVDSITYRTNSLVRRVVDECLAHVGVPVTSVGTGGIRFYANHVEIDQRCMSPDGKVIYHDDHTASVQTYRITYGATPMKEERNAHR